MRATIRAATMQDMDVVWAFVQKKASFDNWLDKLEATQEKLAEAMFASPPMMGALLAEVDGKAVGFATYFFTFSTYFAKRCLWLDDLYVDESKRGGGIGTDLLRAVVQVSIDHGCPRVEWVTAATNAKAISFYEGMGAETLHRIRVCRLDQSAIARFEKDFAV